MSRVQQENKIKKGNMNTRRFYLEGMQQVLLIGGPEGSENTPVVFAQTHWGWSLPGQAPGTAGGLHTQTDCLARSFLGQGPPRGPG